ncbi:MULTISPECIES: hypothetical protein [Hyphomonas]|nr:MULTISPECIES: hypothetical protein [Hyphomonas]
MWKMFKREKGQETSPPATENPAADAREKDFTRPEDFTITAEHMIAQEADVAAAFEEAVRKAQNGEPFGTALYFQLIQIAHNHQAVADLIDQLPDWAFGDYPTSHFATILHAWVVNTNETPKAQHTQFVRFAVIAGWRPGDANAYWWEQEIIGGGEHVRRAGHAMALDILPETLTLHPRENEVGQHFVEELKRLRAEANL